MAVLQIITPITDRTQEDVQRVQTLIAKGYSNLSNDEKAEWLNGLKGSLNLSDLERIENNVQLLSDVLELNLETYLGKIPQIPTATYYNNLLYNVSQIYGAWAHYDDTPSPPTKVTYYTDLNAIEQIINDIFKILNANFYVYAGELYAGEIIGIS